MSEKKSSLSGSLRINSKGKEITMLAFDDEISKLNALIEDRRQKVLLMQKDGDNSHKLLAALYSKPTHFITELLQNAEDEGATSVSFQLTKDELTFSHNAKKLFDFNDIKAISNFGDNKEKKEKPNAIGRFGIGFKSVYSITNEPRIRSSAFDVTIRDYNIPDWTNQTTPEFYNGTEFHFPFKEDKQNEIYGLIQAELQELELEYLLFLSNISVIKWKSNSHSGFYQRVTDKRNSRFISLRSPTQNIKFILFNKTVRIGKKDLVLKIAYKSNSERSKIIPCEKSPLFVFFPTKNETNLKFLVHAPFYTTPARENIEEDSELIESDHRNLKLKQELSKLLVESVYNLKDLKLLSVDLLKVLPIDGSMCDRSPIYAEFWNSFKEELLKNKPLLPNLKGSFSCARNAMLLRSSDLIDLVNTEQAKELFGRGEWLSREITADKAKLLHEYLVDEISIPEYDMASLGSKISEAFLTKQSDNWIIKFYEVIQRSPGLWRSTRNQILTTHGILLSRPIIRIQEGDTIKHVIPFQQDGKPNAFLPGKEQTQYPTVKNNIAENKNAKKFLEELGLTIPDTVAEIEEFIIPKWKKTKMYEAYFDDFKKVFDTLKKCSEEKKNRLLKALIPTPFILGSNPRTGEAKFLTYDKVYLPTTLLTQYFEGNPTIYLISDEYNTYISSDSSLPMFSALGVTDVPRRVESPSDLSWEKKRELGREIYCKDFRLEGLHHFFQSEISPEKSALLWRLLTMCMNRHSNGRFFQGEYRYKYYSENSFYFPAAFLSELKSSKWIYSKSGEMLLAQDLSYYNLPDIYKEAGSNSKTLADILGFKADEIEILEQKTGGKFIPKEEYEQYLKWKASQTEQSPPETLEFEPEVKPENAIINSRDFENNGLEPDFDEKQGNDLQNSELADLYEIDDIDEDDSSNEHDDSEQYHVDKDSTENQNDEDKHNKKGIDGMIKDIGRWGESYVYRELERCFQNEDNIEIIDLNETNRGIGCDFIVKQNGNIIRLVEVKSTVQPLGAAVSISAKQWEAARKYFNMNDGDKYWIYCVFGAGQQNSAEIIKVQNPIKKWKEGSLKADPINFVVKA